MLDRRWLTNDGPLVRELEDTVAGAVGVRHCIATSSGTVALEITARAAGLRGEVIMPAFTFVGTAHALAWQGIEPVFCDIDPRTHTLDPAQVEDLISERTTAILGVHLWGMPCAPDHLAAVADRHDLPLFFDAAHAFAGARGGRTIGTFGHAEVFSFHATKFVNAFEGGAIVTDEDELAARCRVLRNFGFVDYDEVAALGINGKMTEASAAMGLTSLESRGTFEAANRRNHAAYADGLAELPGIALLRPRPGDRLNHQYVVIEVGGDSPLPRDALHAVLWAENVHARRYFFPGCHRSEPYRAAFAASGRRLPATDGVAERVLCLPTGTAMELEDIARICELVSEAQRESGRILSRLSPSQ
jgi:dTDP-4-amino-4,6-dideoxygalactose transaminase